MTVDTSAVLDRIENLPSLSDVVREFLSISRREYITAKDFERVICKDQALVARLLKVANSGLYGKSRSIATVSEAAVLIGLENMKKIVYAVSSEGLMRREFAAYRYPDKGFWLHSLAVGTICRALAERCAQPPFAGEEAFVTGILHDVGQLIIDDFLDPTAGPRRVSLADETAACGLDHTELAAQIAQRWNLSPSIAMAVRYHHDPGADGERRSGAACVALAETICTTWNVGHQACMDLGEDIDAADHADVLDMIGFPPAQLPAVLWDLRQKITGLEKLYADE